MLPTDVGWAMSGTSSWTQMCIRDRSGMVSAAFWASWDPQQGVGISACGEDVTALDTAAIVPVWEQPEPKAEPEEDEESEQPQPRQEGEQEDERVD